VSDQGKIFKLLNPEKNIGVKLTESFIMLPEKSTSGIMGIVE
jgi:cobalamin-dependent methionine synthase I